MPNQINAKISSAFIVAEFGEMRRGLAHGLSHVDSGGKLPRMVDVSRKAVSARLAVAEATVKFPPAVFQQLTSSSLQTEKVREHRLESGPNVAKGHQVQASSGSTAWYCRARSIARPLWLACSVPSARAT